jgi:hypothetical protein
MTTGPTTGGRTTKAERKERARRERQELQRKMERTRRSRRLALLLVLVLVAGAAVFALTRPTTAVADPVELLAQAEQAKAAAGCDPVENVGAYQPEDQDQLHVSGEERPPLSSYASVPPASGPHSQTTARAAVYDEPPAIDRVLHSLEHGAVIVWYTPEATGEELDRLRAFYDGPDGDRVIVAPYDYPDEGDAGRLPAGTGMAMVAWHHVQLCGQISLPAAFDFSASYGAPPYEDRAYLGNAPEAGVPF